MGAEKKQNHPRGEWLVCAFRDLNAAMAHLGEGQTRWYQHLRTRPAYLWRHVRVMNEMGDVGPARLREYVSMPAVAGVGQCARHP
jgi:hypothetical protein